MITDHNGIPFNVKCYKGNIYDSNILSDHLLNSDLVKGSYDKNNRFIADPGYDTKLIRDKLKEMNYNPLIAQNKRNIKDPKKLIKFNKREKWMYNKRLVIERTFNKMKINRRICLRYDSKIENFMGFVYLSLIKLLC